MARGKGTIAFIETFRASAISLSYPFGVGGSASDPTPVGHQSVVRFFSGTLPRSWKIQPFPNERAFLTVRQELKRYQRKGLGYSKDLETHKLGVAVHFGVYNYVRRHHTLKTTPAVAAGLEEKPWSLERVVEMTELYWQLKLLMAKKEKQWQRRLAEDLVSGSFGWNTLNIAFDSRTVHANIYRMKSAAQ